MTIGDNWQDRPQRAQASSSREAVFRSRARAEGKTAGLPGKALAVLLVWVFMMGWAPGLWAENEATYTGDIDLPVDLVTEQGDRMRKGKFQLQVRVGEGHGSLDFRRNDRTAASVSGRARPIAVPPTATKPLTGTLYMRLLESDSPARGRRDNWFKLKRTWKAAMRVYESTGPRSGTVYFVFQFQPAPGQWSRIEFRLQSAARDVGP